MTYEQFEQHAREAVANFNLGGGTIRLAEPVTMDDAPWAFVGGQDGLTIWLSPGHEERMSLPWVWRYGIASAGTGSSYQVLATKVHPDVAARLGGPVVITVLQPWQDSYAIAEDGYLDMSYVAEKLSGGRAREGRLHGGDLAALTHLITLVLGRTSVLKGSEGADPDNES